MDDMIEQLRGLVANGGAAPPRQPATPQQQPDTPNEPAPQPDTPNEPAPPDTPNEPAPQPQPHTSDESASHLVAASGVRPGRLNALLRRLAGIPDNP